MSLDGIHTRGELENFIRSILDRLGLAPPLISVRSGGTRLAQFILHGYVDGRVAGPGTGDGWTWTKLGVGVYKVTFATAFVGFPTVTIACGIMGDNHCKLDAVNQPDFTLSVRNAAGAAVDDFFTFQAIGGR